MEAGKSPAWKEGKELEWKALLVHGLLDGGAGVAKIDDLRSSSNDGSRVSQASAQVRTIY